MKRIFRSIILASVLCMVFCMTASAVVVEENSYRQFINVSYNDFIENYTYYKNLSQSDGYIILIDSRRIDFSSIKNAISLNATGSDELVISETARGIYVPTTYWNVVTQGAREINGSSARDTLYSSKLFYGTTSYEIVIQNLNAESLTFQSFGGEDDFVCALGSGYTAYMSLTTSSASKDDAFYLAFYAPCYAYGYVGAA